MKENSEKQNEIYEFIINQQNEKGYPPSVREICKAVNLKSTSTVYNHLIHLEEKGKIRRDKTKPRAIEIMDKMKPAGEMINIPVVGRVTAGLPILAVENIEDYFSMPINYVKSDNELFMLNVSGQSMIEAGILNGDLAILEKTSSASNGDIVVALIENEATIKRFFKEKDRIRLQPENSTMEPIYVKDCSILGKLVGIYRQY
jgi:repressor LexA